MTQLASRPVTTVQDGETYIITKGEDAGTQVYIGSVDHPRYSFITNSVHVNVRATFGNQSFADSADFDFADLLTRLNEGNARKF